MLGQPDIIEAWKFYTFIGVAAAFGALCSAAARAKVAAGMRVLAHPIYSRLEGWSAPERRFWITGLALSCLILTFELGFGASWHFAIKAFEKSSPGALHFPLWLELIGYVRPAVEALAMAWWGWSFLSAKMQGADRIAARDAGSLWRRFTASIPLLLFLYLLPKLILYLGGEVEFAWSTAQGHSNYHWHDWTGPNIYFAFEALCVLACVPGVFAPAFFALGNKTPLRASLSLFRHRWGRIIGTLSLGLFVYWLVRGLFFAAFNAWLMRFSLPFFIPSKLFTPIWLCFGPVVAALTWTIVRPQSIANNSVE